MSFADERHDVIKLFISVVRCFYLHKYGIFSPSPTYHSMLPIILQTCRLQNMCKLSWDYNKPILTEGMLNLTP